MGAINLCATPANRGASKITEKMSAAVVSSRSGIHQLASKATHLLQSRDIISGPAFFLASIESRSWIPRVVEVNRGGLVQGLVYAKERRVAGLPTGLIYADATLDRMVVSEREEATQVLSAAITHVLRNARIQGLRILVPSDHHFLPCLQGLQSQLGMDVLLTDVKKHCVLNLHDDYATFLNQLGSNTRRNFRYYRRRFESAGNEYVPAMPFEEFRAASACLLGKGVVGAQAEKLNRALDMLQIADRPVLVGLRDAKGTPLAVLGGWYEADRAVIFCQMNDDVGHPQASLCTVLRGYLFEQLISQSVHKVLFWDGIGGPLQRHSEFLPTTAVCFDRRTLIWRSFRKALGTAAKYLPHKVGREAQWISPALIPKPE